MDEMEREEVIDVVENGTTPEELVDGQATNSRHTSDVESDGDSDVDVPGLVSRSAAEDQPLDLSVKSGSSPPSSASSSYGSDAENGKRRRNGENDRDDGEIDVEGFVSVNGQRRFEGQVSPGISKDGGGVFSTDIPEISLQGGAVNGRPSFVDAVSR